MKHQADDTFTITDLDTLKVVADARRMKIVENIVHEACTVKEIAERLNQPASQLYYHINMLEKHGLIRVVDTRIVSGIIEKWYGAAAKQFHIAQELLTTSQQTDEGREQLFGPLFDSAKQELKTSIEQGLVRLILDKDAAATPQMIFLRGYTRMSQTRFQEFKSRMDEVLKEFSEDEPEDEAPNQTLYSGLVAIFPTPNHTPDGA